MKQRILTAIIALIIFVPFVIYGNWPFVLLTYVLATIGWLELMRMRLGRTLILLPSIIALCFLWMMLLPKTVSFPLMTKPELIIIFVMLLLAYTVLSKNKFTFDDASFMLLATIYISMGFYFLIQARMMGLNYILFILFIIWATDTGAYFLGSALGKRKLWPKISPNKTIEGALGGIVLASIVGVIFQLIYPFNMSMLTIIIVSIVISVVGQIGDLTASAYKRHFGVKDSGQILPGHGGILDRLDSLLFVLPLMYIIHFI
ncbi:MAG TPA: phosphatidate cytidylyltransferase [Virgibacillus sp.]|nr:phosphatidate cytidylyltransferase [Virgibacillus sp.]